MHKILSLIALREKEKAPFDGERERQWEKMKKWESEHVEAGGVLISKSDIFPLE